jgi:DNA (cytosine-5)-methyltransferase 1
MKYISLFSGIGGFDLGFERASMECVAQVEIDDKAREVLARHWPDVPQYTDVREFGHEQFTRGTIDLICGGFPCQDLSIAGRRAGLAGERSGLWFEFARIIDELEPRWVVIENVPGLLSSNDGKDFAIVIGGLTGIIPEVPASGWQSAGIAWGTRYKATWRVLDSQYFGLAQRRRRVFVVASLGSGRAAKVLLESEGMSGDLETGRETGKGFAELAGTLASSGGGMDRPAGNANELDFCVPTVYNIMPQNSGKDYKAKETSISQNLTTNGNHSGDQGGTYVVLAHGQAGAEIVKDGSPSLTLNHEAPIVFGIYDEQTPKISENVMPTLRNRNEGGGFQQAVGGAFGVRRLTPTECARLQGFPDDWNDWLSDTVRYRQYGNAVSVPPAEWIGRRIMEAS